MGNADKNQHGSSFQQSIEYFIVDLCGKKGVRGLSRNKRLGYDVSIQSNSISRTKSRFEMIPSGLRTPPHPCETDSKDSYGMRTM